jgi:hypothetical protein
LCYLNVLRHRKLSTAGLLLKPPIRFSASLQLCLGIALKRNSPGQRPLSSARCLHVGDMLSYIRRTIYDSEFSSTRFRQLHDLKITKLREDLRKNNPRFVRQHLDATARPDPHARPCVYKLLSAPYHLDSGHSSKDRIQACIRRNQDGPLQCEKHRNIIWLSYGMTEKA